MKFSLSWLANHLDFSSATLHEICDKLTSIGLEVEEVVDHGESFKNFVVGHVVRTEAHPNANRLNLCHVDIGEDSLVRVVCGAPNARAGINVCYAQLGAVIPALGSPLKLAKIRDIESCGMLCSAKEMNLGHESDGIMELPEDLTAGSSFAHAMGYGDPVIEIGITPNRADCLGVRGIARDLSAAGLGTLKPDPWASLTDEECEGDSAIQVEIDPNNGAGCSVFIGRTISGIKNCASPMWLQQKLQAIGLSSISAVVDVTNYVAYDRARPLHGFDAKKISGHILVRASKEGESFLPVVKGSEIVLADGECVITDKSGVLGLAGIMGGASTGVSEETTEVFIEAALFDPVLISHSGRRHNLNSDARYRFERGVDSQGVMQGVDMATRLILDICGGRASKAVIAGEVPKWHRQYDLRASRCASLGGYDVPVETQRDILERLGFGVSPLKDGVMTVQVPSWRMDVEGEEDLVEEVLRVFSLNKIPEVMLPRLRSVAKPAVTFSQRRGGSLSRRLLASRGMLESITYSFVSEDTAKLFGWTDPLLKLTNPISQDLSVMRPSILINLLAASGRNANRGFSDVALFEVGPVFRSTTGQSQTQVATGLRAGKSTPLHWSERQRDVDAFDVKADVIALLAELLVPVNKVRITTDVPGWYHPSQSGVVSLGQNVIAYFGTVHPSIMAKMDLKGSAAGFEVFIDNLPLSRSKNISKSSVVLQPVPVC